MDKLSRVHSLLLITVLSIVGISGAIASISVPASPVLAAGLATERSSTLSAAIRQTNSKSLWDWLFGKKTGRGGSRGTPFCSIWPNVDDQDLFEVWSDRPLFIWKARKGDLIVKRLEVRHPDSESALWGVNLTENELNVQSFSKKNLAMLEASQDWVIRSVQYNHSVPLNPGQEYDLIYEIASQNSTGQVDSIPEEPQTIPFKVTEPERHLFIKAELEALENQNPTTTAEKLALQKARYFAEQGFWSDVIQEIFSVQNPSSELNEVIEKIRTKDSCLIESEISAANSTSHPLNWHNRFFSGLGKRE